MNIVFTRNNRVWLYSEELRPRWLNVSKDELDEALCMLDDVAADSERPMHAYDNWNIGMTIIEDRTFHSVARVLERGFYDGLFDSSNS